VNTEEKMVLRETQSNDLLLLRLIKLHPYQLSYSDCQKKCTWSHTATILNRHIDSSATKDNDTLVYKLD
jgi:hypothetical protein